MMTARGTLKFRPQQTTGLTISLSMVWDICVFAAATAFLFCFVLFCLFKVTETPDEMPAVEINLALTLVGQLA